MPTVDDELVVLRAQQLGEADRIVTCIGKQRGKTRAVVRGVRRTTSKIGARLEPFNVVDVQLFTRAGRNRGLDTVTQVVMVHPYSSAIRQNYVAYAAANVVAEAADQLLESEPAPLQYALIVAALRDLATRAHPADLVLAGYLLRSLALAGWQPTFTDCARCGAAGPHPFLSVALGGAICTECAPAAGSLMPVDIDTMRLCWALLAGNWRVAEATDAPTRSAAMRIVRAYVAFHLEHELRSLALFAQVQRDEATSR